MMLLQTLWRLNSIIRLSIFITVVANIIILPAKMANAEQTLKQHN